MQTISKKETRLRETIRENKKRNAVISELTPHITTEKTNNYVHAESKIKEQCRNVIVKYIKAMFPYMETLNTMTLGGEKLMIENALKKTYKLNGVSYEFNPTSIETAKQNAPKGIEVRNDDIFNHVYTGTEQFLWFDFMTSLRPENVGKLINWIVNNPIKNDCIFVATYTLHSRRVKGEGYRQLFTTEDEHEQFISEMKDTIGFYLENENVGVDPNVNVIRYCNTDISKKSLPMVQFIFKLRKK